MATVLKRYQLGFDVRKTGAACPHIEQICLTGCFIGSHFQPPPPEPMGIRRIVVEWKSAACACVLAFLDARWKNNLILDIFYPTFVNDAKRKESAPTWFQITYLGVKFSKPSQSNTTSKCLSDSQLIHLIPFHQGARTVCQA